MPMITLDAIETAYMRHVHGKLEPDTLLVTPRDYERIKRVFDSCRRGGMFVEEQEWEKLGFATALKYLNAVIRADTDVDRGYVHVMRTGVRLGTEPLYLPAVVV